MVDRGPAKAYFGVMTTALDTLSRDAMVLPPGERLALAHRLLESIEPAPDADVEAAWEAEIATRIARYDAGESKAIPASEVFARLREIAPGE